VKDDLSRYLHEAERAPVVITRHGHPAGILIGFEDADAWFEYQLVSDPRFQARIRKAREQLRRGEGTAIEDLPDDLG
jgi:prevent-host-death family protein